MNNPELETFIVLNPEKLPIGVVHATDAGEAITQIPAGHGLFLDQAPDEIAAAMEAINDINEKEK